MENIITCLKKLGRAYIVDDSSRAVTVFSETGYETVFVYNTHAGVFDMKYADFPFETLTKEQALMYIINM